MADKKCIPAMEEKLLEDLEDYKEACIDAGLDFDQSLADLIDKISA